MITITVFATDGPNEGITYFTPNLSEDEYITQLGFLVNCALQDGANNVSVQVESE